MTEETPERKIDKSYLVDNVTFCSDADMYPREVVENPMAADFWFNHLKFNGGIYVFDDESMRVIMEHRPEILGTEGFGQLRALFRKHLNAGENYDSMSRNFRVNLEKAKEEFSTYGHDAPSALTFVIEQPNEQTGKTSLLKIHSNEVDPFLVSRFGIFMG